MNDKHKNTLRMAAEALKVGRVDARLADSLLGIISSAARATPAQPVGSPHNICREIERGLRQYIAKLEANAKPSPSSVGDAIRAMPLPKSLGMLDYELE